MITAKTADGTISENCRIRILFSDVTNRKKAAFEAVYALADRGVIKGFRNGEYFSPEEGVTRAQTVLFLWRLAGKPDPKAKKLPFSDAADIEKLAPDYKKAILWAHENGIAMGFTGGAKKGKFLPNDTCTRAQIVLFLYRYAGSPAPKGGAASFKDQSSIRSMAPAYEKAVFWAVREKIARGYGDGTFRPEKTCTRGECATFLYRMNY